jgi:hypothetical protein
VFLRENPNDKVRKYTAQKRRKPLIDKENPEVSTTSGFCYVWSG